MAPTRAGSPGASLVTLLIHDFLNEDRNRFLSDAEVTYIIDSYSSEVGDNPANKERSAV